MILFAALALGLFAGGVLVGWGIRTRQTEQAFDEAARRELTHWSHWDDPPRWNATGEALDAYERAEG